MKRSLILLLILCCIALTFSLLADTGINSFEQQMLDRHNLYRAKHGAPPLRWNSEVEAYATQWARRIASQDRMYHRQPNRYGENIYWISGGTVSGEAPVDAWYGEIRYYNYSSPGFSMQTGHFTQVVWKASTELGCGKAQSARGGTYVVCNYSPPGNYMRRFRENVVPPR